jgi:hypothetical protein
MQSKAKQGRRARKFLHCCVLDVSETCLPKRGLATISGVHIKAHKGTRLATEELAGGAPPRQVQGTTQELEDPITEPSLRNGRLRGASTIPAFRRHVACNTVTAVSSGSTITVFRG